MDSIDVFDTAIFRDVYQPTDIFTLIEQEVGKDFRRLRIEAENKASASNRFYTIQDIYKYLYGFNLEKEIEMEMKHVYANPKILSMYMNNPNNYVFISDMYLSSETIKKLLEICGYKNPRVFVSCEAKCNKGSGILFNKVQKFLGKIDYHYGDNYKSDIQGAVKQGINPIFHPALHKQELNLPAVKNPILKKYAAELEANETDPLVILAKYYAPLIYDFTKWVLQRQEGQSVYFLSRDMFMPYFIAKNFMHEKNVYYIYCSRKSLCPLIMNGKDKTLIKKMTNIFGNEAKMKKFEGIESATSYLKSTGIKNNDIIADIGYAATSQRVIEQALKIKLCGKYIQLGDVPKEFSEMNTNQYLNRMVLTYRFLAEFVFTSPEDNMNGYINGKPSFTPDYEERKEYAKKIAKIVLDKSLFEKMNKMNLSLFDIEQMLIHIQTYPSYEIMELFNKPILTNRKDAERGINFDREKILKGGLMDCYRYSYAKPLFKKMLEHDKELNSLVKLLPQ